MITKTEFKIIADHLRSSCFLIADGVLPSNEGRGYVLRRIMRRAMRQLHKLGAKEAGMYKLVDSLIKEMGDAYPELARARDVISETLKNEEEKFRETLGKGLKILEEEISKTKNNILTGEIAFKLYDTYGFPLDLTQDILKEKSLTVDEEAFKREMESQRQRARKNWVGSGEEKEDGLFFKLKEQHGETKFLGYDSLESEAEILAIEDISSGKEKVLILSQTPFYATSGGQKGDDGTVTNQDNVIKIKETKKFAGNLFAHLISDIKGDFKVGDKVTAQVNAKSRQSRSINHSATHLMHKALKKVLGNSISQKGSNVDVNYFTFDFNFNRAMSAEEITEVENRVNNWIKTSSPININSMDLEKARETGAEALFGEKYDDQVRVVSMGPSIELCGGTHVKNTSEIEIFKIISEKSVASGIRRIEAKSALGVRIYLKEQQEKLDQLIADLQIKIDNKNLEIFNLTKVEVENTHKNQSDPKILEEILKKKDKEIENLKKQALLANLDNLTSDKIGEITLVTHLFEEAEAKDIREIVTEIKKKKDFSSNCLFAFFAHKNGKVATCIAMTSDLIEKLDSSQLIKPVVEKIGGKGGGGKKDLAMGGGTNKDGIPQAIETLKQLIIAE